MSIAYRNDRAYLLTVDWLLVVEEVYDDTCLNEILPAAFVFTSLFKLAGPLTESASSRGLLRIIRMKSYDCFDACGSHRDYLHKSPRMELQDVATHAERFDLSSVINSVRFLALKRAMVGNWLITPFEFSASKRKTRWSPGESSVRWLIIMSDHFAIFAMTETVG